MTSLLPGGATTTTCYDVTAAAATPFADVFALTTSDSDATSASDDGLLTSSATGSDSGLSRDHPTKSTSRPPDHTGSDVMGTSAAGQGETSDSDTVYVGDRYVTMDGRGASQLGVWSATRTAVTPSDVT